VDAIRIDIVSDVVCPWCIVGYQQLEQAMRECQVDADIYWQPFELNPAMVPEGEHLSEHIQRKYGSTAEQSQAARENLVDTGRKLGFEFRFEDDMRIVNTFLAHQLLHWAALHGRQHQLKITLFHCYFNRQRDIGENEVLANAAVEAGLDYEEAMQTLQDQTYAEAVRERQRFAISRGIRGVPAMIFAQSELLTGAQGTAAYKEVLTSLQ